MAAEYTQPLAELKEMCVIRVEVAGEMALVYEEELVYLWAILFNIHTPSPCG